MSNPSKKGLNSLTITLIITIGGLFLGVVFSSISRQSIDVLDGIVDMLVNVATNALYLIGAGMLILGASLFTVRFLQCKLNDPYKPPCVTVSYLDT